MKPLLTMVLLPASALGGVPTPSSSSFSPSPTDGGIALVRHRLGQMPVGSSCAGAAEGAWYCMTDAFQRCASGEWSAVMACAPGTTCEPAGLTYASQSAFGIGSSGAITSSSSSSSSSSLSTSAVGTTSSSSTTTTTTTGTTAVIATPTSTSTTVTVTTSVRTTTATTTAMATATATGETSTAGGAGSSSSAASGTSPRDKNNRSDAVNIGGGLAWWKLVTVIIGLGGVVMA